jgi:hypothetical protein
MYGRGTWTLELRQEHELRVFENRVLSRIFGPRRDEVIGGWFCEHGNEPPGSITYWENLQWLRNWRLLQMGPTP